MYFKQCFSTSRQRKRIAYSIEADDFDSLSTMLPAILSLKISSSCFDALYPKKTPFTDLTGGTSAFKHKKASWVFSPPAAPEAVQNIPAQRVAENI
jgi:hypothetical protein